MAKGDTTSITIKRKSPFRQLAMTLSANDNGKGPGVREIAQGYKPRAPVQRAFNAVPHMALSPNWNAFHAWANKMPDNSN